MSKAIAKGSFVVHEKHPEHGLGRVIDFSTLAIRVLFQRGGLRVFRNTAAVPLAGVTSPLPADIEQIAAKEVAMAQGAVDLPSGPIKEVVAAKPKRKAKAKAKEAEAEET